MDRRTAAAVRPGHPGRKRSPTLRELADHLGLAPATVSTVMNGSASSGIAPETQRRIREAARKPNYRPNFLARCLRTRRSLSTVRQPLEEMGRLAAEAVLQRITRPHSEWAGQAARIVVKPELVVRATTAAASPRLVRPRTRAARSGQP